MRELVREEGGWRGESADVRWWIDAATGRLTSWRKRGEEILADALQDHFVRAPLDNDIGSSEVVENRVHTGSYEVWALKQGTLPVDEQDFFAIAGDAEAATEIERTRKIGLAANYGGLGAATLGGTLMLAGLSLPWLLSGGIEDPGVLVGLGSLTTVGGLFTAGGVLATIYGRNAVEAEHHQPLERAQVAADSYNRALGDERLAVK